MSNEQQKEKWPLFEKLATELAAVTLIEEAIMKEEGASLSLLPQLIDLSNFLGYLAVIDEDEGVLSEYLKLEVFANPKLRFHLQPMMDLANREGHGKIIGILQKHKVRPSGRFLLESIAMGDTYQVELLLRYGAPRNASYILEPDHNAKIGTGVMRLSKLLARVNDLLIQPSNTLGLYFQSNPEINEFFDDDGYFSLYRPWSPVMIAAISEDIETLKVLQKYDFKLFKHELSIMGKLADEMLSITEQRKVKHFSRWWHYPLNIILGAAAMTRIPIVPQKYTVPIPYIVGMLIGGKALGTLGSVFVEQHWTKVATEKKLRYLLKDELETYRQLKEYNLLIDKSMKSARK